MADREKQNFRFEPLDKKAHNRAAFSCEHEALNIYVKERASQEIQKRVAAVYVLTPDGKTIAGYYTLSQYTIEPGDLPEEAVQRLHLPEFDKTYDKLPATLLGRLARSREFKGAGLGEILLMGAFEKALQHSKNIASLAIVVDAKDEKARSFYLSYGFIDLPDHPNRLFMLMQTVEQLFRQWAER